jgi:hypothetical protein
MYGRAGHVLIPLFVIVGVVLNLCGNVDYVLGTVKGRIKPNVVTWSLWSLPPLVGFLCEINGGAGPEAMLTFALAAGPVAIVVASIASRHARRSAITGLDRSCAALSLATVLLWVLSSSASVALTLAIATDAVAAVPTAIKTYREPDSESRRAFILFAASAIATMLAIKEWNMVNCAYPTYIFALSAVILTLTTVPRRHGSYRMERIASRAARGARRAALPVPLHQ